MVMDILVSVLFVSPFDMQFHIVQNVQTNSSGLKWISEELDDHLSQKGDKEVEERKTHSLEHCMWKVQKKSLEKCTLDEELALEF